MTDETDNQNDREQFPYVTSCLSLQTFQTDAEYSKDTDEDFKPWNYVCVFCSLRKDLTELL